MHLDASIEVKNSNFLICSIFLVGLVWCVLEVFILI